MTGSPLTSIAFGPIQVVWSSSDRFGGDFLLERHHYLPGERKSASIKAHIVSLVHTASTSLRYRRSDGHFVTSVMRPNTVLITPAGPLPDACLFTPTEFSHCAFDRQFLARVADEIGQPTVTPKFHSGTEDKSMLRIMTMLTEELEAKQPSSRLYVDSLVYALATRYLLLDLNKPVKPKAYSAGLTPRTLNRVRAKIEANLDANLNLQSLAAESGYSRAHFLRMFRVATGVTPHKYVLDLRVKRAQERLRQANSSIVDVALSCGFSSQSHMTSVFRRQLETTPGSLQRIAFS